MLHVYGVIEQRELPTCSGIDGSPLTRVDAGVVSAVAGVVGAPVHATEERLWEHESVLEMLSAGGPVLPVRFGVAFSSRDELAGELAPRAGELQQALDRVRGRVEVAVRVVERSSVRPAVRSAQPDDRPGTGYLLARLARQRDAEAQAAAVRAALSPLAVAERTRLLPRPATLLAAAYLIAATELDAFRAAVEVVQDGAPDVAVICTGPWPPYNFVDEAA